MELFVLITRKTNLCVIVLFAIVIDLTVGNVRAQETESTPSPQAQQQIEQLLRKNESKWRETYQHEIARPPVELISDSTNFLPAAISPVMIGCSESELLAKRPTIQDKSTTLPAIRDVFDFVPATLVEQIEGGTWKEAHYRLHKRRLVRVTLTSASFPNEAQAHALARPLCARYLRRAGTPSAMQVSSDVWGKLNRGMLIWRTGSIFAVLIESEVTDGTTVVSLIIGAEQFYDDTMKYYATADLPSAEVESFIRKKFPFLAEALHDAQGD